MNCRALVTGAGGFIGSHLVDALLFRGYDVTALVRYTSLPNTGMLDIRKDKKNQVKIVYGDILDYDFMKNVMKNHNYIFHLAALNAIPYSYTAPQSYFHTNVEGTLNILRIAKELKNLERLLITSTSEVYGTAQKIPITEQHPINPQSPYAASKVAADAFSVAFKKSFDIPLTLVRPFNTYGPRQSLRAVIPTIITQLLSGGCVHLGSVTPTRDFVFVKDTVRGFIDIAEADMPKESVINIATNTEISINNLVSFIAIMMKDKDFIKEYKLISSDERKRPENSEVFRLCGSNDLLAKIIGTGSIPRTTLEKGISQTVNWFLSHREVWSRLKGYIK